MIEALISSKTRIKLLLKFFLNPNVSSYLRGLESEFDESSNAIRVELNRFENAGLLLSHFQGNKKFFKANQNHPFFDNIQSMLMKYTGLDDIIERVVDSIGDIEAIYLVGELANGIKTQVIDIVIFGDVKIESLKHLLTKVENTISTQVNCKIKPISEHSEMGKKSELASHLLIWCK
jgi:hypothetical protein